MQKFGLPWSTVIAPNRPKCITKSSSVISDTCVLSFLTPQWHQKCICTCVSPPHVACGGAAAPSWAAAVSRSLVLHRAESGSLTRLIAFDSSLSSPVDQWSSVLFIRNINAPHIPTASASAPLLLLVLRDPCFRNIVYTIVCFSWFQP